MVALGGVAGLGGVSGPHILSQVRGWGVWGGTGPLGALGNWREECTAH